MAAYARGGLPEVVGEHGRFAPAGDVSALGDAILKARTLSRTAARRHAVQELSIERMVSRYERHYRFLAGHGVAA